jgi:hypothetical protein
MKFWEKVENFWDEHHLNRWTWGTTAVLGGMMLLTSMVTTSVTDNIKKELQPIKEKLIPPEE